MTLAVYSSHMPVPVEDLFQFHMDATNLRAIQPPFPPFELMSEPKPAEVGDLQVMRIGWKTVGVSWHARITHVVPGRLLEDVQEVGPFRKWRHQHRCTPDGTGSRLTDAVSFSFVPTPVGGFIDYWAVRPVLLAMFAFRHRRTRKLLAHSS